MWEGCSVSFEEETSALDWPSQRSRHLRIRPQFSSILPVTQKPGHFPAIVKIISTVQWSTVHHHRSIILPTPYTKGAGAREGTLQYNYLFVFVNSWQKHQGSWASKLWRLGLFVYCTLAFRERTRRNVNCPKALFLQFLRCQ